MIRTNDSCPCGKDLFDKCCKHFLSGEEFPKTCEELMRSRYTAFCLKDAKYIGKTMMGPAKKGFDLASLSTSLQEQEFLSLEILRSSENDHEGTVEFKAVFSIGNQTYQLHEKSYFIKENGIWFYYDGEIY